MSAAHKFNRSTLMPVLLMPSFYGGVTWICWLSLYLLDLVGWEDPSASAVAVFVLVAFAFLAGTWSFYPRYVDAYHELPRADSLRNGDMGLPISLPLIAVFHAVGFIGLAVFWYAAAGDLGGLGTATRMLVDDPATIRMATMDANLPGVELTYLGWAAIFLTVLAVFQKRIAPIWIALAALQFAGNLVFIDRTRPMWIISVSFLLFLLMWRPKDMRRVVALIGALALGLLVIFLAIARWGGRLFVADNQVGDTMLPAWSQNLYLYGTGGFAYFSHLFRGVSLDVGLPERTLAPFFKVLALFGVVERPPSEVLEFAWVPYPTNVGTFLEPFYRDGGLVYVAIGIVLYSFGLNLVGLLCLKARDAMAAVYWANICFMSAIGFFVPKVGATAIWLFAILAVASVVARETKLFGHRNLDLSDAV